MMGAKYHRSEAKEFARAAIKGIFLAFCLPETVGGEIDEAALRGDVRYYIDVLGADGLYIHGFYGNYWLLTSAERKRVMEVVADEAAGAVPLVCRCAHQSMRETIDLIQHAEEHGADFISLIGPAYANGADRMVVDYFEAVADATELGISIFNTPQAGYVISPDLMARLAEIPNVCALKNDIDLAHTAQVRELVGDTISVIDPSEENLLLNMTEHGQRAIYTGTGYMFDRDGARPMHDYVAAALRGDMEGAAEQFHAMRDVRDLHHRWVLEPWSRDRRCPIATIKNWIGYLGLSGGPVRPPLPPMRSDDAARLRKEMQEVGLLDSAFT